MSRYKGHQKLQKKKKELNLSKTLYNSQFYNPDYLSLIWAKIWLTKKLINENPEIEWFFYISK